MSNSIPDKKNNGVIARTFTSVILYRNFRLMWMGSLTEHLGEWMEIIALLWLINEMTNSPVMATLLIALRYLPLIVFSFVGGIVADRINRRDLLIYTLIASAVASIVMAVLVHTAFIQPWHLLAYSAFTGIYTSFNHPARNTLLPNLVKREHFLNAITLDNSSVTSSRIIGAPLAGFLIGLWGTTPVLGVRALGAILAILWLKQIDAPATVSEARKESPLSNLTGGIRYVAENRPVLTQVLLYLLPFFVSNTYTGLLPYIATNVLHIGPDLYGIMNAAPGVGSVISTLVLASLVNFRRKSITLLFGGIVQGLGLIFLALSPFYITSLILLVVMGGATTLFMSLNNTLIQEMISDHVRGRVMALREVAHGLGPSASLVSGAVAGIFGVPVALGLAGGVSIVVLLTILIRVPRPRSRTK